MAGDGGTGDRVFGGGCGLVVVMEFGLSLAHLGRKKMCGLGREARRTAKPVWSAMPWGMITMATADDNVRGPLFPSRPISRP